MRTAPLRPVRGGDRAADRNGQERTKFQRAHHGVGENSGFPVRWQGGRSARRAAAGHNWPHVKTTPQAGGIVFRRRQGAVEILLVSPKRGEAAWIFPKGHLEHGETPAHAALRE